ncbi:serine/threonine-protein kinase RIO1 [Aspergillus luchuensis]|uniref:Serine/threonine-protein kinase RIO1 n=1 Tax=Aspergillus kawachii TaxID=1069201 RepID=A0A146FLH1_ASPKA|nr:protein kinase rio1 [Aspergillus luchuensis]BCR96270.1 protein kinase rio1 [Aspergillus luchuensis]BCS08789.1 protein kinase rio1 [Aspergillus luchuensis]GAA82228.1 serine/threonine-protein kinase RIO1 [Aspergillus luchuensis IFO 4308]GAT26666.1 serine/threonine-protein kinase RIO1 [Aspergillus luchuensis]
MAAPNADAQASGLADGLNPAHTYIPNQGYVNPDGSLPAMAGQDSAAQQNEDEEDDYYDDIFEEELDEEDFTSSNPADLTKSYNRQRKTNELSADPNTPKWTLPKTNTQKPSVNTRASVDDQVKSLTKHAGKIKLDDMQSGMATRGDRGGDRADRATSEQVLDPRTRMILLQMINREIVSEIHGCLSTGKEANVYYSISYPDNEETPLHRAIKVYKTSILVFKDRDKYVTGEFRFRQGYSKSNNRAMVKLWAEKEMRNLRRIYAAGIPCPEPIHLRLHVLVMGFVGNSKGIAAPRLKDVEFNIPDPDAKWREIYMELLGYMRVMYQTCHLVHADLSEYNMLYHKNKLHIIDVSQSVEHDHPRSLEFLRMDIKNISDFFRRKNVDVLTERAVFEFVISSDGPTTVAPAEPMLEAIEHLFATRNDNAEGDTEVDAAVFRQQYIPQTLEQVYDFERDAEQVRAGKGDDLVYRDLLAGEKKKKAEGHDEDEEEEGSEAGSDGGVSVDEGSDSEDGEKDPFAKKAPRGKRFEDKDEKRDHKQKVKEEKREKRANKMPKHMKKRLVSSSSRKKK